jgi:hypothetical protein
MLPNFDSPLFFSGWHPHGGHASSDGSHPIKGRQAYPRLSKHFSKLYFLILRAESPRRPSRWPSTRTGGRGATTSRLFTSFHGYSRLIYPRGMGVLPSAWWPSARTLQSWWFKILQKSGVSHQSPPAANQKFYEQPRTVNRTTHYIYSCSAVKFSFLK